MVFTTALSVLHLNTFVTHKTFQHVVSSLKNKTSFKLLYTKSEQRVHPLYNHWSGQAVQRNLSEVHTVSPIINKKTCLHWIINLIFTSSLHFVGCNERIREHSFCELMLNKNSFWAALRGFWLTNTSDSSLHLCVRVFRSGFLGQITDYWSLKAVLADAITDNNHQNK